MKLYSGALELDGGLATAYNNRALAHLKLNNLADAEADCGYVLRLEPHNVKALLRRGTARQAAAAWTERKSQRLKTIPFISFCVAKSGVWSQIWLIKLQQSWQEPPTQRQPEYR